MKSISLVGFMGAGKTVTGELLAQQLKLPFIDLDAEIQRLEDKSISRIFTEHGEAYFRQKEWEVLMSLQTDKMILAVGGGAYTIDDTINLINSRSISVWLDCPIEICLHRCSSSSETRPLFDDPLEFARLYKHRKHYYKKAKYRINTEDGTPAEVVKKIIDKLKLKD